MPKTSRKTPTADEIAELASRGEDVSAHFTNKFTVVRPVRLNVSRQAVAETFTSPATARGRRSRSA